MNFTVSSNSNYTTIASEVDKLNASNSSDLKATILKVNKESCNHIIIDLSKTTYCDSSGLSAILSANRLCKDANGIFILTGLQSNVRKMIEIAQLHRVLSITDSLEEAQNKMP